MRASVCPDRDGTVVRPGFLFFPAEKDSTLSQKGSVGASGDLAPMAQAALLLMGEGEAFYQGERLPGKEAMQKAGIPIPGLQARDGLAAINGSNLLTAMSAIHIHDMERFMKQAEIAAAMSLEALLANMKPYDTRLHELRGFKGAVASGKNIRKVLEGSDLTTGKMKPKVQDAYSMRSSPQVIGAAHDAIAYAKSQVEIELNSRRRMECYDFTSQQVDYCLRNRRSLSPG